MRRLWISSLFVVAACASPRAPEGALTCPAHGETAADCPWATQGRLLADAAARGGDVVAAMNDFAPEISAALANDALRPELMALWGTSSNVDELTRNEILPLGVTDALEHHANLNAREGHVLHAGIAHTYGYLLSVSPTSFGYKRARWVLPDIALAFSLPAGALGPRPAKGTLLANVTYFAGRIAFRKEARARATLLRYKDVVETSVAELPYDSLAVTRLTEAVALTGRAVVFRTDFVPFPRAVSSSASTHLLVYSILDSAADGPRLVTLFPVNTAFVQKALDPATLGDNMPITPRYNAFVRGISGVNEVEPRRGHRGADGPAPP